MRLLAGEGNCESARAFIPYLFISLVLLPMAAYAGVTFLHFSSSSCPSPLSPSPFSTHQPHQFLRIPHQQPHNLRTARTLVAATGPDMLGDFGARDPFPAELESNFGEKVLGNVDTEHKILIPDASALSLSQLKCSAVSHLQQPMPRDEAKLLLFKVVGWRLLDEEGGLKLQCVWKLRDYDCGVELINRIAKVAREAGHFPSLHLEQPCQVRAELWTPSIGGLSMNDFIMAAKIDKIKISDLVPRKRIWA